MALKNVSQNAQMKMMNLEYGKVPPQAVDIEEAVIGAVMLEKDAIIEILDILKPESFYKDAHQKIFQACADLSSQQKAIDLYTVTEELRSKGLLDEVGGPLYLTQLTSRVVSAAHVEYHAKIIAQKFIQRELIRASSDIQEKAFDNTVDVDDLLDYSEAALFKIAEGNIKKESAKINAVIKEALRQIEQAGKNESHLSGVPSGYTKMDRITNGWQRSDLIIIAARPSMGKTAFVLSMTRNMAVEHKRGVAIFSLEMSSVQLVNRLIVGETQLSSDKIRTGRLEDYEWQQLETKIKDLVDSPIYIDDTPGISIFELRAKCRRLKRQYDIDMIIIDYLQLMAGPPETRGNREQEVSTISRSLKILAKELNVPVIALSQLNRSVEMRSGNKRPQLSDLRESGAIEQDADMVLFIHRPEKYGFLEDEEGNSLIGLAEIIIAKHRNGGLDDVRLKFEAEFAKFSDLDGDGIVPLDDNSQNIVTYSSKMNEDTSLPTEAPPPPPAFNDNFDLSQNTSFDDEAPF